MNTEQSGKEEGGSRSFTASLPREPDVEYEVWQQDAFGDGDAMVAGSTSLADAWHYAAMYSQDAPAWVVEVSRRRLAALSATPSKGE